jgi:hypothetical protein
MTDSEAWFIIKQSDGHCEIVSANSDEMSNAGKTDSAAPQSTAPEHWGPFTSQQEAIARRVGLIRAGKCQPI